ncbi:hypothetical protein EVJ32_10985 [Exiguobacterium sp. SH5S4]|uniref:hypothetical protein n=1 Tax=Exiguobacterium sp. SH5S4 TaxID=2510961 RepID=UPI00103D82E6|nr:hypothetical protein [Exiguobacterium sp. SH5S4]TCI25316.1 hypothetical protein EVJ32_10985 [Exiguobacterium sp. SH5S4]
MLNIQSNHHRVHTKLEQEIVRFIIGDGFGLYESYANDVPVSIKQKCDFEMKTQGAVRVAYGKEYLGTDQEFGQDIARSIGGVLHYHESSFGGVTHWTPNVYYRADKHHFIAQQYLRRVKTLCFDVDQKMSVNQILFAFEQLDVNCSPFLILSTPKGVQFFVSYGEAWFGSEKAITYSKSIASQLKKVVSDLLPIDDAKDVFGWARFPREETVMYFDPSNTWNNSEAKEWFAEQNVMNKKLFAHGGYLTQRAGIILQETGEVGMRNKVLVQLGIMAKMDGLSLGEAEEIALNWNAKLDIPLRRNAVTSPLRTVFRSDYKLDFNFIESVTGHRPRAIRFVKHKKSRDVRSYDHKHELVHDIQSHFEKVLPEGEGESMPLEVSTRQLADTLFGEVKKHTSITRALEALHKADSRFVVRKKVDRNGKPLRGRGAGYLVYRTQDLLNMIKEAKQMKKQLLTSLVYRAATFAERHHETYTSKTKDSLEINVPIANKVSTRTLPMNTQYLEIIPLTE